MACDLDIPFLRRAIRLAMLGRGTAEPNPLVGCVLARDGRVIGEGYHARYGGPHAEPNALASCIESPAGATAYVTLEPCCHTNKHTPPCAPRFIEAGIARVVIGCLDPNPDVNGKGVRVLRNAGIAVDGPILEPQCLQLIAPFIQHIRGEGPYVTLKWAESADGKIAGPGGKRTQISGPDAKRAVHGLRGRCDAVAVGIKTVLNDDPLLLPRNVATLRWPHRYVLDTHLRLPLESQLVHTASEHPVTVFCGSRAVQGRSNHAQLLRASGVEVFDEIGEVDGRLSIQGIRREWARRKLTHVLIEPGPTLATAWMPSADRLWMIRSPHRIDDTTAPHSAVTPSHYIPTGTAALGHDLLTEQLNTCRSANVWPEPSADFCLSGPCF